MSIPSTMRAVRVHEHGTPDALSWDEVPVPEPGDGEVLVRLEATGVNFIDTYQRSGQYPRPLPFTPGSEGAGTVAALGPGVAHLKVGDAVASARLGGSYAEYAVAPAGHVVAVPGGVTVETAAALLLQGLTAHYLATSTYPLEAGEWCLVHAGAGGVGRLLIQIARSRGARVITTVSTEEKAEMAAAVGAEVVIRYDETDFVEEVRGATGGAGVSVVYDSVGRATFEGSLDCLAPRGILALFGQSSGAVPSFDPQILNRKGSLFLTRPSLGHYTATPDELAWRSGELFGMLLSGRLKVHVHARYPLQEAAAAHRALEGRETMGKVLLIAE